MMTEPERPKPRTAEGEEAMKEGRDACLGGDGADSNPHERAPAEGFNDLRYWWFQGFYGERVRPILERKTGGKPCA